MNYYVLLPLVAFVANILLGCYILYQNSKSLLNRLYSLFTFTLAIWALGDIIAFSGYFIGTSYEWFDVGVFGIFLMPVFLLHFCLVFSKRKITSNKIAILILYLPGLIFLLISLTTDLTSGRLKPVYWGYTFTPGILYTSLVLYLIAFDILCLFFIYHLYRETESIKEKKQTTIISIAIIIPLIGGIITEAVPPIVGYEIVPLSTALTTFEAIFVAYAVIKYELMAPMSFSIQKKLVTIFLIISAIFIINGYISYTATDFLVTMASNGFCFLLIFLLLLVTSKSMSKPIIKLRDAIISTNGETLDTKIDIVSNDEIGDLVAAFNKMTKNLRLHRENLEKTVAERTKELNKKIGELERYRKVTINRELKMVELKKKINELHKSMGKNTTRCVDKN